MLLLGKAIPRICIIFLPEVNSSKQKYKSCSLSNQKQTHYAVLLYGEHIYQQSNHKSQLFWNCSCFDALNHHQALYLCKKFQFLFLRKACIHDSVLRKVALAALVKKKKYASLSQLIFIETTASQCAIKSVVSLCKIVCKPNQEDFYLILIKPQSPFLCTFEYPKWVYNYNVLIGGIQMKYLFFNSIPIFQKDILVFNV